MIPDKLTLEGLYSYQERQTIDFNALTQAGLFGVFGAVGSGKSSILEAITFALFGKTERLNERGDSRNYNMMNLKSNRTYIEFDFHNFEDRHFRITREYRRHKSKFRDVLVETPVLYECIADQWIPLEHTDVEPLIGLSYTNFKRTIIIPQGQFKEFLELGNRDRTQMMKEIFNLHRFDLQDKVAILSKKNQSQLDTLTGQLSGYEEITAELIQEQEQLLREEKKKFQETEQAYKLLDERFQLLKKLKADVEDLAKTKKELLLVAAQEDEMNALQRRLSQYEQVRQAFYQLLIDRKRLTKELEQLHNDRRKQQADFESRTQQQATLTQQFAALKVQHEKIADKKDEANDFELLAKINSLAGAALQKQSEIRQAAVNIETFNQRFKELQASLENNISEIEQLRKLKLDSHVLMEAADWFARQSKLEEMRTKSQSTLLEIKQEVNQIDEKSTNLEPNPTASIQAKEEEKRKLLEKCAQLDVQQKLAEYAHALHDGQPCPLCGALEHPHIAEHSDLSGKILRIRSQIQTCEQAIALIQEEYATAQRLAERKKIFIAQFQKTTAEIEDINIQLDEHRKLFIWEAFDATNRQAFEEKRQYNLQLETAIREKEQHAINLRLQIEDKRKEGDQLNNLLTTLKLSEGELSAQITNSKSHLRVLDYADFEQRPTAELLQKHQELLQHIRDIEVAFTEVSDKLNTNRSALAAQESLIGATSKQIANVECGLQAVQQEVNEALNRHNFGGVEEVRTILVQQMDIDATRSVLERYRIKLESLRNLVSRLESNLRQAQFDEQEYINLGQQVGEMAQQVKKRTETVAQVDANLLRINKQYEDKKELHQKQDKLQKRADNLRIMSRLFKAQGFVEYVSSIFLRQLCDHANIRFRRMTRNQLSLSVNEENDFEIIDYLNEGRSRNVKTLSGGQAFQVSLSLALALAESVQSQSKANRNFFFIDEGFGTQDSESVNMVFETLLSLQKENRIVGIISHVEELKERIPAAINIHKDEARGSIIIDN